MKIVKSHTFLYMGVCVRGRLKYLQSYGHVESSPLNEFALVGVANPRGQSARTPLCQHIRNDKMTHSMHDKSSFLKEELRFIITSSPLNGHRFTSEWPIMVCVCVPLKNHPQMILFFWVSVASIPSSHQLSIVYGGGLIRGGMRLFWWHVTYNTFFGM